MILMRTRLFTILIALTLTGGAYPVAAQEPGKIVDQYVKAALQLEVTAATGVKRQVFFDAQTHLIAKEAATVSGIEEEILYDDYRTMDGVKLPHKIELHRGS